MEQEIIRQLRAREEAGAAAFLVHYAPLIRYVIGPILPNDQDREECLSEIALRVWEKIDTFDPARGSFTGWLTAVARNAALNKLRREHGGVSLEALPPEFPAEAPTPEEQLLRRERQEALRWALEALPARECQLFYRKYYYHQSTAQIAAELGMTQRAVEGRLYRIKNRLRRMLGGEEDG